MTDVYEDLIGVPDPRSERQRKVEEIGRLSQMGLTQQQIGDRLEMSQQMVSHYMQEIKKVWRENMAESYDEYVAREAEHYRILLKSLEAGIAAGSWKHVETAIKLAERRSRLIGLDHSDRMEEARVRIEAAQLDMMSRAFNAALDAIGASDDKRRLATETLLRELESGEASV